LSRLVAFLGNNEQIAEALESSYSIGLEHPDPEFRRAAIFHVSWPQKINTKRQAVMTA
jgi:hypothetical protein